MWVLPPPLSGQKKERKTDLVFNGIPGPTISVLTGYRSVVPPARSDVLFPIFGSVLPAGSYYTKKLIDVINK